MFSKSTNIYDLLYKYKNYKAESNKIKNIILKENKEAVDILDVACGTGEHAKFLKEDFSIDGLDINNEFLKISSTKNEKGNYYCGSFIDFELNKKYDAILCLFSSFAYCKSVENLNKMLLCFRNHLNKNGVIVLEPWFTISQWKSNVINTTSYQDNKIHITRISVSKPSKNSISYLHFDYLIRIEGQSYSFTEEHEMGLFSENDIKDAFRQINHRACFLQDKLFRNGLYVSTSNF